MYGNKKFFTEKLGGGFTTVRHTSMGPWIDGNIPIRLLSAFILEHPNGRIVAWLSWKQDFGHTSRSHSDQAFETEDELVKFLAEYQVAILPGEMSLKNLVAAF